MLIVSWLSWWYGPGWIEVFTRTKSWLKRIYLDFSVPLLLRTLFSPWRRLTTSKGGSLEQKLRASLDNGVSRTVGLAVRISALGAAGIFISLGALSGAVMMIAWPFLPVAGFICIVVGIFK